jgi:hypothetical protein
MDLMFLYPLIGGATVFTGFKLLGAMAHISRLGYNLYNSGIGFLLAGVSVYLFGRKNTKKHKGIIA